MTSRQQYGEPVWRKTITHHLTSVFYSMNQYKQTRPLRWNKNIKGGGSWVTQNIGIVLMFSKSCMRLGLYDEV